jgi:tetratricopeptide (TPR) repeat protein
MNYRRLLPVAAALSAALGLVGCATTISYVPNDETAHMSLTKARRVLAKDNIKVVDNKTLVIERAYFGVWITYSFDQTLTIPLKDIQVSSGHESFWYHGDAVLQVPGYSRVMMHNPRETAEAIFVLKRDAEKHGFAPPEKSEDARFEDAAKTYLAADVKPELDADTRRFKVQAEDALREKRFEDVADIYGEALEANPAWPAGHYNRALVLSELKEYPAAMVEMKRYLRLSPDAVNAQAAQDQIYKWEAKVAKK